jgi:hypothetical protein
MAWRFNVLVVANVTADSPELLQALRERAARESCSFTLLVPAPVPGAAGREAAAARLEDALAQMREAGLDADGTVGDHDVAMAVHDAWDPRRYDDIVVCTLPTGSSKWLQVDLPHRIGKLTGALVSHVVSAPPSPPRERVLHHREEPAHLGVLTPLGALAPRPPRA